MHKLRGLPQSVWAKHSAQTQTFVEVPKGALSRKTHLFPESRGKREACEKQKVSGTEEDVNVCRHRLKCLKKKAEKAKADRAIWISISQSLTSARYYCSPL